MDILFKDGALERLCREEKRMRRMLGSGAARKLRARLKDLSAASSMRDMKVGRPHALRGDLEGCIALDLDKGRRLVLEAGNQPVPRHEDGSIDWTLVTNVRIVFVGDYHG